MRRSIPWIMALLGLAGGLFVWSLRARQVEARNQIDAESLVERAYTEGIAAALKGTQRLVLPGASGREIHVEAEVLAAGDGRMRIDYQSPPLRGVTVWQDGSRTYRYNPREHRLTVAQARRDGSEERFSPIPDTYSVQLIGRDKIAGRPVTVVELRKPTGDRRKRLCIDDRRAVILCSEDYLGEKLLRSSRFTEVEYLRQAPDEAAFHPPAGLIQQYATARAGDSGSGFSVAQLSRLVDFRVREPGWLPDGYTLEGAYQTPCSCPERHPAARLEYSDGLSGVTLFQCGHPCKNGENCFGSAADHGMAVARRVKNYSLLAIGDLPEEILRRIVASVPASDSPAL